MTREEIQNAYDQATGNWSGCDWTTTHGSTEIDLDGEDYAEIRRVVERMKNDTATEEEIESLPKSCSVHHVGLLSEDYSNEEYNDAIEEHGENWVADLLSGADWLEVCEASATAAEEAAAEAMKAVNEGRLIDALEAAERASSLESIYGDDPIWGAFSRSVAKMVE